MEETKRRDAVKLAGLAIASPAAAARILQQAAAEAMEFTRQAEASALGSGTLDHLDLAITEFNRAYSLRPPKAVFDSVLDYRRKVSSLLKAKHTHQQGRELFAFAGWLSELLAWLAHDLGDARTGLAFATDAFVHGRQAGHGQLCAWAMDAAASINLYEQRPGKALKAARKGLTHAPADHPLTVRLHAQAARAAAADGDAEGFTAAFHTAEDAYRLLPPRPARRFGMDVAPLADYALTSYPATSFIWLGQADQARQHAEHALATYESAPEAFRSPSREAIARIDLALAHAQLGNSDDAVALGHQALDSARVVGSVLGRAGDLTAFLTRRYPRKSAIEGLCERLTAVNTAARRPCPQPRPEREGGSMATTQQPQSGEHSLNIRKPYFDLIEAGIKTIEVRVGYAKVRKVTAGDGLRFNSGGDSLLTLVTAVKEYKSFEEMLNAEDNVAIGKPGMTRGQLLTACRDIYPPEKEDLGVFAIHLAPQPG